LKRVGNLFDKVFSQENLYQAYLDARKGKRKKRACHRFTVNLGANLEALYDELHSGTYHPRGYFEFTVHEPKERKIYAPAFRDIVVQHAIYRHIYPIFDRTFIDQSCACRKGGGTHKASDYTQQALASSDTESYVLKLDVRKFFYSIPRDILCRMFSRKIKDYRLVRIMTMFVEMVGKLGIPIGNLLSQLYALIFLNPVDHFIKRVLKVKRYVRYVDDMVLIGFTRAQCLEMRDRIGRFLRDNLRLTYSKTSISKVKRGVNFVGYRTWAWLRIIRKYSLQKFRRAIVRGKIDSVVSLLGHARRTASLEYMYRSIISLNPLLYNRLPRACRKIWESLCRQQTWTNNTTATAAC
jgi:retron-type reverse transcriptase